LRIAIFSALSLALLSSTALAEEAITKMPSVKRPVEAVYPPLALKAGVEAVVVLDIDVDATGHVTGSSVVSTSTSATRPTSSSTIADWGFVAAAQAAAMQYELEPAEAGGKPIAVQIAITFRFKLPLPELISKTSTGSTSVAESTKTATAARPGALNFTGVVRERGTRVRLNGIRVTVFRGEGESATGFEAITDGQGNFGFRDLDPGEWRVIVEADGYYPFRTTEEIHPGEAIDVTYYLERGSYNPFDVLVEAPRVKKEVNRRTLRAEEISRIPGTLDDAVSVVENLPGVARPPAFSGEFIVRGSGPNDSATFIDGIDVPLIYHFGGLKGVIPTQMVESADFYPGNYPVAYGGATGGIYDIHTKSAHPDQVHGSLDVSTLDTGLYLTAPLGKDAEISVAGRRSYVDAILNAAIPASSSINFTTAPRYYDYQASLGWRPNSENQLKLLFFGSNDKIELLFKNPANIDAQFVSPDLGAVTDFQRLVALHRFARGAFKNELRIAIGRDKINFHVGGQYHLDIFDDTLQVREVASVELNEAVTLSAGFNGLYYLNDVSIRLPRPPKEGDPAFDQNFNDTVSTNVTKSPIYDLGPFVEAELRPLEHLSLFPALRADYFFPVAKWTFDPRIVGRFDFSAEWTAKAGIGLVHQAPQPDETDKAFGNPDLGPEKAVHYSAGVEWHPLPYLSVDATLYYKDLQDLVSRSNAVIMRDGMMVPQIYDNNGVGRSYGLELYVKHSFANHLWGWLTYTLSRSERKDSGATDYRLFSFDQTHIFNLILTYYFPENWNAGIRWRVVSGNPYTPVTGGVFLSDFDRYAPIPGAVNSGRLPLFNQLDIRVEKQWIWDKWTLSAYFQLINAYNRQNAESFVYNYNYTQSKPQSGLPIFPVLGLKGEL
jgi:TonB family protein